jgi:hypothetical protein
VKDFPSSDPVLPHTVSMAHAQMMTRRIRSHSICFQRYILIKTDAFTPYFVVAIIYFCANPKGKVLCYQIESPLGWETSSATFLATGRIRPSGLTMIAKRLS